MSALTPESGDDLLNLLCGAKIGEGTYRTVFECALNDQWVVKMDSRRNWSNVSEHELWCELQDSPLGKWLAPIKMLSPGGIWLVQARTEPIPTSMLPKRVPALFADLKRSNWGLFEGRPVCHDYGNHMLYQLARRGATRLKAAHWRLE